MTPPKSVIVLREQLASSFSPATAYGGRVGAVPSVGHCAAAALIVREVLGGALVSAPAYGENHWFNRIEIDGAPRDVDITGDQFGLPAIQVAPPNELYPGSDLRSDKDVASETARRAVQLAREAGLPLIAEQIGARFAL